jgi:hypothetical protein
MKYLILTLCLASCSPRQHDQETHTKFPNTATMQAAEDAGQTPSK